MDKKSQLVCRDLESERESGVGRESEPEDGEVMRRREGGRESRRLR